MSDRANQSSRKCPNSRPSLPVAWSAFAPEQTRRLLAQANFGLDLRRVRSVHGWASIGAHVALQQG
jgi:hypothetical protein